MKKKEKIVDSAFRVGGSKDATKYDISPGYKDPFTGLDIGGTGSITNIQGVEDKIGYGVSIPIVTQVQQTILAGKLRESQAEVDYTKKIKSI